MCKEQRRTLWGATLLLLLESLSLFRGQEEFLQGLMSFFGISHPEVVSFFRNLLIVEGWMYPPGLTWIPGLLGFFLTVGALGSFFGFRKITRKGLGRLGLWYGFIGMTEVLFMDISIIGWISGSLFILGGFYLYQISRKIF